MTRLMPKPVDLGHGASFCIGHAINMRQRGDHLPPLIMGFRIPSWQRPLVWTPAQDLRFVESAWRGLPLGTYTYNQAHNDPEMDGLLIDGQQRMMALQRYLDGVFPVFGYRWSELDRPDQRSFENRPFHAYVTQSTDDAYLRGYYDLMNFSGTAHKESERAS